MRQILGYFGKYKKYAYIGAMAKFIEAMIELSFPFIMAYIIDYGIKKGDRIYTVNMSILLIILALIGVSVTVFGHKLACKATYGLGHSLRQKLFDHILVLSVNDKQNIGNNSIINRLNNDVALIEKGIVMMIRLMLRAPFICIGGIILTLFLDLPLALVIIAIIPILGLFVYTILRITVSHFKITQSKLDILALDAKENVTGLRVIKAFNKTKEEKVGFALLNISWQESGTKMTIFANSITPFTALVMNIGVTLIILIGAYRIDSSAISQGTLVAFITYVNIIINALIQVTNLTTNISKAFASSARVTEVLNIAPSMEYGVKSFDDCKTKENYIQFNNVDFAYHKRKVVQNISFNLNKNQTLGILGGTGSGKSTIVNLLARIVDPLSGSIIINGHDIREYNKESFKENVAVVYQNDTLIRGTIEDNIVMGRNLSDEQINKAIKVSQTAEIIANTMAGLNQFVEEGGKNLSGGQKQRITIARALAGTPKLLIFDDSFSALDYLTDYRLRKELQEYHCTKIFVSQRISTVKDADLILLLQKGCLVACGTHSELIANCQLYQAIDASQKKVKK